MKQTINIGTVANDGTGDLLRDAFDKVNDNFNELYSLDGGNIKIKVVNGVNVVTPEPIIAQINADTGLTPATAGNGYVYFQKIAPSNITAILIFSDGAFWYHWDDINKIYHRVIT